MHTYKVGQGLDIVAQGLTVVSNTTCVQPDGLYSNVIVAHDGGVNGMESATVFYVCGVTSADVPETVLAVFANVVPANFALDYSRALLAGMQHALAYDA